MSQLESEELRSAAACGDWPSVLGRLTDLDALTAAAARGVDALLADFDHVLRGPHPFPETYTASHPSGARLDRDALRRLEAILSFRRGELARTPETLFGSLYEGLRWYDAPDFAIHVDEETPLPAPALGVPLATPGAGLHLLAEHWRAKFEAAGHRWLRPLRPEPAQPADLPHFSRPGEAFRLSHDATLCLVHWAPGTRAFDVRTGALRWELPGRVDELSRDGTLALVASDRSVAVWDVVRGVQRATVGPLAAPLTAVALSHDGASIAAATEHEVRILDSGTAGLHASFPAPGITRAFFVSEALLFVAASDGFTLVDPGTAGAIGRCTAPYARAGCAPSRDRSLVAVSPKGQLGVVDTRTLALRWSVARDDRTSFEGFSPDGTHLVAEGRNAGSRSLSVHDTRDGTRIATLDLPFGVANGPVAAAPGAEILVAARRLWDPHLGNPLGALGAHGEAIAGAAFSPDGTVLVGQTGKRVAVWDLRAWTRRRLVHLPRGGSHASISGPGRCALVETTRLLTAWSLDDGRLLWSRRGGRILWRSRDEDRWLVGAFDASGAARIVELGSFASSGAPPVRLDLGEKAVYGGFFSGTVLIDPTSRYATVVLGEKDALESRAFDLATGRELWKTPGIVSGFHHGGRLVRLGVDRRETVLFDGDRAEVFCRLPQAVSVVAVSRDRTRIAYASGGDRVEVRDARTLALVSSFQVDHHGDIDALDFHANGRILTVNIGWYSPIHDSNESVSEDRDPETGALHEGPWPEGASEVALEPDSPAPPAPRPLAGFRWEEEAHGTRLRETAAGPPAEGALSAWVRTRIQDAALIDGAAVFASPDGPSFYRLSGRARP